MKLREIERTKIECALKFLKEISQRIESETEYAKLMDLVGEIAA